MNNKHKVYITASSSSSCAGETNEELFQNICDGKSGIAQNGEYFYESTPALGKLKTNKAFEEVLFEQCQNILQGSNLEDFSNTLLIIGSSVGGMSNTEKIYFQQGDFKKVDPKLHNINAIATILEQHFSFYDTISFSTACTSSANGLGYAYEVLSKGIYQNVLVVGVDQLSFTTAGGFLSLGVLSSNPCKPFDINREGMNVAEAIACVLLQNDKEEKDHFVELCGVGYSSDAYHITQPHPEGDGAKESMQKALQSAGLNFDQIDYINAHGTGTLANDSSEAKAIERLFLNKPYVSSTKSITGHTLGAAGAIEAIICQQVLQKQIIPKSSALEEIENTNINFTFENIEQKINYVMSNSFAFGGNNCSLIFGKIV